MPTAGRREFVRRSIELFMAQDYPAERRRLVIVEDGGDHCADIVNELNKCDFGPQAIDYVHIGVERHTIGEKRNIACARATGDLIAHWDDDDWHSSKRLSTQVDALQKANARICGADRLVFYRRDPVAAAWIYRSVRAGWLCGGTLVYERALWLELGRFQPVSQGEDTAFVDAARRHHVPIAMITDESLYVAMLHEGNTETKVPDMQWGGFAAEKVRDWMEMS